MVVIRSIILCLFLHSIVVAQEFDKFRVTQFTMNDGLPINSTNTVTQSPDRFLWISTYNGFVRFDGVNFKIYDASTHEAFRSNRIRDTFQSEIIPGIWLQIESGGVIHFDYENFYYYGESEGFTDRLVLSMMDHPSGLLFLGTNDGTFIYDGSSFKRIMESPNDEIYRTTSFISDENIVWMTTSNGVIKYDITSGEGKRITIPGQVTPMNSVQIHPNGYPIIISDTGIYIVSNDKLQKPAKYDAIGIISYQHIRKVDDILYMSGTNGVFREVNDTLFKMQGPKLDSLTNLINVLETSSGHLLGSFTDGELIEISGNNYTRLDNEYGLSDDQVHYIFEDDEGNIWVTTRFGGLVKLTQNPFTYIGTDNGLPSDNMMALFEDSKGRFWMSVRDGGVFVKDGDQITRIIPSPDDILNIIHSITEDVEGNIWLGAYEYGLFKIDQNFNLQRFNLGFIAGKNTIYSLYYDSNNSLWIGTLDGIVRFKNGERIEYGLEDGLPHLFIRYITEDPSGNIWVGTQGNGIAVFDETTSTFSVPFNERGLQLKGVLAIEFDEENNGVWVGTEAHGLFYFGDDFDGQLNTENGLPDNVIHSITKTDDDNLWMHTNRGIFYGNRTEILKTLKNPDNQVNIIVYNSDSGMRISEGNGGVQPSSILDKQGLLWFSTQKGIAGIDPFRTSSRDSQIKIIFEKISTRNTIIPIIENRLDLPTGQRDIQIEFTAINLTSPNRYKYQYRIAGYNDNWIDVNDLNQLNFTNLPRGVYDFELRAVNLTNNQLNTTSGFTLAIPPMWYETVWFYVLILCSIIGLMYGAIRYNLYKEYKVQEKLRALVDERTAQLKLEKQAVVERNFVIRKQSVELAKMNKAKDNFIYLLGHDMRSPLQSMLGTTSILETDYDRLSESERNELIQLTKSAFGHLNNLITNLLDWAQMDAGLVEPKFENVELNEMIRQIINLNSHALNKKTIKVTVRVPEHLSLITDSNMLQLALRNIFTNAIKFSEPGATIVIECKKDEQDTFIHIIDNGLGMSQEQVDNLFKIGRMRSTRGTQNEVGTGLGLFLVWEVINLLNAKINIESQPGEGTTFTIQLDNNPENRSKNRFDTVNNEVSG